MTEIESDRDYLKTDRLQKYIYLYISANRYLGMLERHRRTDTTIQTYTSTMRTLISAIGELKGEDARLEDLTEDDIYSLMETIRGKEATVKWRLDILGQWMESETGDNLVRRMSLLWNAEEPERTFISID